MKRLLLAIACFTLAAGCARAPADDAARVRETIAELTKETEAAENAGSVEQMRKHFAEDIVMMAPNMPAVTSADSVAAAMQAFFDAFTLEIEYDSEEIVVVGDWAFDRGIARQTMTPKSGGPAFAENGKYLWLYRRAPDGSWKQSRVIWNSSDPIMAGTADASTGEHD